MPTVRPPDLDRRRDPQRDARRDGRRPAGPGRRRAGAGAAPTEPSRDRADRSPRRVRRTAPADEVWKGYLIALAVFVFLASGNMVASAEGMPIGWQRNVALTAANSVDRISNLLSLNRPYDWAAGQLGLQQANADFDFAATSTTTVPTAVSTTLPPLRVPTAAAPLKVAVAGDSTALNLGDRLKVAAGTDQPLDIDVDGKVSTGLARSDYFNWGARLKEIIGQSKPELVVFMVGANDAQSILDPDGTIVAQYGTDTWNDAYRQRVAGIMDLAHSGPRRMMWVGQPKVGNAKVEGAVEAINSIAREEAAKRPWVSYFDMAELVAGPDGNFAEYVTLPGGRQTRCFSSDDVHLSMSCLDYSMESLVPDDRAPVRHRRVHDDDGPVHDHHADCRPRSHHDGQALSSGEHPVGSR